MGDDEQFNSFHPQHQLASSPSSDDTIYITKYAYFSHILLTMMMIPHATMKTQNATLQIRTNERWK